MSGLNAVATAALPTVQILTPIIFLTSALIAYISLKQTVAVNRHNKRADIIMHCNNRYDDIYKFRIEISDLVNDQHAKQYYARYWGLKSDQFDYWLAGWVDIETFTSWFYSLLMAFKEDRSVGGMSFQTGWSSVGLVDHKSINPLFNDFVAAVMSIKDGHASPRDDLIHIIEKLEKVSRKWRKQMRHEMKLPFYKRSLAKDRLRVNS